METSISKIDDKFKIVITDEQNNKVEAPLPNDFGITVGSEFSTPFDTGDLSLRLQQVLAISGISRKTGFQMKKLYTNPERSELSFDLEFVAYSSALREVVIPVKVLMLWAVGKDNKWPEIEAVLRKMMNAAGNVTRTGLESMGVDFSGIEREEVIVPTHEEDSNIAIAKNKALGLINIVEAPPQVTIKFGRVFTISESWISSVSPRFSNILDSNGLPLSATVSCTVVLESAPTSGTIHEWFNI